MYQLFDEKVLRRLNLLITKDRKRYPCKTIKVRSGNWRENHFVTVFEYGQFRDKDIVLNEWLNNMIRNTTIENILNSIDERKNGELNYRYEIQFEYYNGLKTEISLIHTITDSNTVGFLGIEYINTRAVPLQLPERAQG